MTKLNTNKVQILGVAIDRLSIDESIEYISNYLTHKTHGSIYIVKPYVEFMVRANQDKEISNILNSADLCLADGVSLQWAASYLYGQPTSKSSFFKLIKSLIFDIHNSQWREQILKDRGAGADATIKLLKCAEKNNWRIGIIGGKASDSTKIHNRLKLIFPKLNIIKVWSGFFEKNQEIELVSEIKPLKLDILFVARGFPSQEQFIYKYRNYGLARVLIGEGGTFDYDELGGTIKRAPRWMRQYSLEWLWRLILQPWRIFRMLNIPRFIWQVYSTSKLKK